MRTAAVLLLLVVVILAQGCNATGGTGSREPAAGASAGAADGRLDVTIAALGLPATVAGRQAECRDRHIEQIGRAHV